MRLHLLAASTLVLAACGGTDVDTAETTQTDAYDDAVIASEDQPPLEGDSPFVDDGARTGAANEPYRDGYADADDALAPGEYREPIGASADPIAEPATFAGTYDLAIDGQDRPAVLVVDEGGAADTSTGTFTGTFDGAPVEIATTDDRFTFDAPVTMDGEEQLMTFSGLLRDGRIEDGAASAQGDGSSVTYTATRTDEAALTTGTTGGLTTGDRPVADDLGDADSIDETDDSDAFGTEDPLLDQ